MSTSKPRFDEIDLLRGLSCLAVVAFHYLWRGQADAWVSEAAPVWLALPASFGFFGVHLFFMISGFVIFMSAQGATVRGFAASRAARLYPALWVAAPFTAAMAWWGSSTYFQVDFQTILVNLTLLPQFFAHVEFVDGAYWSLAVEVQFYMLMALLVWKRSLDRIEWALAGWLLLSVVDTIRPVYALKFWLVTQWAPFFAAGIVAYRVRSMGLTRMRAALYGVAWALGVICAIRTHNVGAPLILNATEVAWVEAGLVTLFFALFALIALGRLSMRANFWTRWAGMLTYPVYLVHQNFGYIGIDWLHRHGVHLLPSAVVMLALTIGISVLISRCVEKPLGRWLRTALLGSGSQKRLPAAAAT